jgi:hypothetical protein
MQKPVRVPRPLVDAMTQQVKDVSERFALSLHLTLSLAFDDAPSSSADLVLLNGKSVADYVSAIDYRRIVHVLVRFKCCHLEDLTSLFVLTLVYMRRMKSRSALPLLEQMIVWFDASNVVYCVAFLAHSWLFDKAVPLRDWHEIAEGVVKGVNLNKCVRNCLRILKYELFPSDKAVRCAKLAIEYQERPRVDVNCVVDLSSALDTGAQRRPPVDRGVAHAAGRDDTAPSQLSRHRFPFAQPRRVRRP